MGVQVAGASLSPAQSIQQNWARRKTAALRQSFSKDRLERGGHSACTMVRISSRMCLQRGWSMRMLARSALSQALALFFQIPARSSAALHCSACERTLLAL